VAARTYVLATGGIETPRLLLMSDRHERGGIGNRHDLVGRYFMDHPRLRGGEIRFADPAANSSIYDLHRVLNGGVWARGVKVAGYFGLTAATQRAERLGATRCYAVSRYLGVSPATYVAVRHLRQARHDLGSLSGRSRPELANVIKQLPSVALLIAGHKSRLAYLARGFSLETVVEPTPLAESRVALSHGRDRLGMARVTVDWRLGELEKRTIRRTQEILAEDLRRSGAGTVVVEAPREDELLPDTVVGCWHHMGTTRMADDPRCGVVDAQCRVHGVQNLYIASSSVFPTGGADMPTLTIVALAMRLADHIKETYRKPSAYEAHAAPTLDLAAVT
jgi:choline dehydrogenase-like flavoprotein